MTQTTRIGSYAILSLGMLLAGLWAQSWLQTRASQQLRQINDEAVTSKRARLIEAFAALPASSRNSADFLRELGQRIDAHVEATAAAAPIAPGFLSFTADLPGGEQVAVSFAPPPVSRLLAAYHRAMFGLVILCPLLFALGVIVASLARRPAAELSTRSPWERARSEATGLERFARLSVERGAALEREHVARQRAEENLQVSRIALDRSLEERIRLGRELHDNISQTLYAVGLTLESVQRKMTASPEIESRLDQCRVELRRLNQEVRTHIRDLGPETVRGEPLAVAFESMLRALVPDHVKLDQRLDGATLGLVPPEHATELINLVREAVSNSVRHGGAHTLVLRAAHDAGTLAFSVADDGRGFDPSSVSAGHGLANMRARATAIGGVLQIDSSPGKGTRVLLTLPVTPSV